MNCLSLKMSTLILTLLALNISFAGWQVAKVESTIPNEPFFQASAQTRPVQHVPTAYGTAAFPNQFANLGRPAEVYAISVSGSLKENIERIMDRYHWKVVWKAPYDYNFDGRVTGTSLPNVMEKLLKPFPLQAVLYMSNRTMTVEARKA